MKALCALLGTALLIAAASLPAWAQEGFDQTVGPADGSFTARIPTGWVWVEADSGDALVIADSDATLNKLAGGDNPQSGDRLLFLFGPEFLATEMGAAPGADLNTLAEALLGALEGPLELAFEPGEILTLDDGRAAIVSQTLPESPTGGGYIIIDNGDGRFIGALAITTPEDIEAYGATLAAIVLSVTLADVEAPPATVEIDPDRYRQWAVAASATSEYSNSARNATQATGAPDTKSCGDAGTAWASSESNGQETLTLRYAEPVVPAQVNIHQTYNPGSIVSVELVTAEGGEVIALADSADPPGNTPCPGIFTLDVAEALPAVNQIIVHLDQSIGGNWNEIDAVELVGKPNREMGIQQWAVAASATSEFSSSAWSATQATGAPDTKSCGDSGTAWASSDSTGVDALTVRYAQAVVPTQVNIYQTYNPGSIVSVELVTAEGGEVIELSDSADPPGNTLCPGVFTLNIAEGLPAVNQIVIYLDQSIGGNWNEIDAVELVGKP